MKEFVERMVKECYDLKEKCVKLHNFIVINNEYNKLPVEEQNDLIEQLHAMEIYLSVLERRLKRQGYDVADCSDVMTNCKTVE